MNRDDYRPKGFTLMELLVSLAIFGVISGFVMVNFRAGARSDELRLAAGAAVAALRDAEARAAAGAQSSACAAGARANLLCPGGAVDCPGSVCVARVPAGGYGIDASPADPGLVALFADHNGDGRMQEGEKETETRLSSSGSVLIETIGPDALGSSVSFIPPTGRVRINGGDADAEFFFALKHSATGARRRVSVNRVSRLIEVTTP